MYKCLFCYKVYRKRKNALEHVMKEHNTDKVLASACLIYIGDAFRVIEKPVDDTQ